MRVANGSSASFSPDGNWIAYRSNESGRDEVYVRPRGANGPGWRVSTAGGGFGGIVWNPVGRELYFKSPGNRIMVVGYEGKGNLFIPAKPRVWNETSTGVTVLPRDFSMSADGKRFAVIPLRFAPADQAPVHVTIVLNFLDELRRLLH